MMEHNQPYRILWQKNPDNSAKVIRMYGTTPIVTVPPQIAGYPVVEIAPYCFSEIKQSYEGEILEEWVGVEEACTPFLQELCKTGIEEVILPSTVSKIGNYAFYNCKNLKILHIGTALKDIGGDAFMNAISFRELIVHGSPEDKSEIRQILNRISSEIEVQFWSNEGVEAILLYPEYYESYDEIAPAHLFGRSIQGEGFRARQCIKDGKIDFAGYDDIFSQACVEETEATMSKMALNRLRYPYALSEKNKEEYQMYIKGHITTISNRLIKRKELEILQFLCQENLLCDINLAKCIQVASEENWVEGTAILLQYQVTRRERKKRYEF